MSTHFNNSHNEHELTHCFKSARSQSMAIIKQLSAEDCQLQAMPDASPSKWHLAHTTWFFEYVFT
ncbi:hypothetical protein P20652_1208 [Pseudoalteromonas sp. BSi20652]|uniref:DinB family protein n=1 Tax=Pseudoalteromonas sp. BSi20652 TaxID=388384 RepID=UPI000231862E|nr:DinB family protein [Pseudoalteromonas sp. BSi20652]GAA59347.1 hypothetical protein P20652_1208 [Pseudoalteromonas sp. BSi20652]